MKSKRSKHNNQSKISPTILIVLLALGAAGVFTYQYVRLNSQTRNGQSLTLPFQNIPRVTTSKSPAQIETILNKIQQSIGYKPKAWDNATLDAYQLAPDLIQVIADYPNLGPDEGVIEYWTNNRTGTWELLGSYSHGQQGPGYCEDWEKLKVAKGMSCARWVNEQWVDSKVDY